MRSSCRRGGRLARRRRLAHSLERAPRVVLRDARRGARARRRVRADDFAAYVAGHSSEALLIQYKLSAFWGGQEGSLLLWLLVLTAYSALAVWFARKRACDLVVWVTPVLGGDRARVLLAARGGVEPVRDDPRACGRERAQSEPQNLYMVAHLVFLYLGYVGLAVPFASATGALLSGRTDERWIVATRRRTPRRVDGSDRAAPRRALGLRGGGAGTTPGDFWARGERGADPRARRHGVPPLVMIQEKRGMLRVWNVTLVSPRSASRCSGRFSPGRGAVSSIHSFTQSAIGPWFLGFIIVAVAFSTAMIWLRLPQLRRPRSSKSLVSREAAFLYNNLLLVALCLMILWGTAWPMVSEAVRGESVVVGRPY